jgi:hypothetical protein
VQNSPVEVMSIRCADAYLGKEPPTGSRYVIHALVRFDTQQVGFSRFTCTQRFLTTFRHLAVV